MGDFVYAISSAGVTATNLTTMDESASVELAYESPYNTYYYDVAVDSDAGESTTSEGESSNSGDDKTDSSNTEGAGSEPDQT